MRLRVKLSSMDGTHRDKTLPETIMLRWMEDRRSFCASRTDTPFTARFIVHYISKRQIKNAPQTRPPFYSPRVKLVNDALEANNCEKSRAETLPTRPEREWWTTAKTAIPPAASVPPDRPPPLPPHPAGSWGRPLPETEPPALELALCLQSEAVWCSAMFWRIWLEEHFPPPRTPLSTNPLPPRRQYFCATRPLLQLQVFDVVYEQSGFICSRFRVLSGMLTGLYHSHEIHCRRGENRAVLLHTAGRIFQPLISRQVETRRVILQPIRCKETTDRSRGSANESTHSLERWPHKRKKRWQEVGQSWLWISITDTRLSQSVWRTVRGAVRDTPMK